MRFHCGHPLQEIELNQFSTVAAGGSHFEKPQKSPLSHHFGKVYGNSFFSVSVGLEKSTEKKVPVS